MARLLVDQNDTSAKPRLGRPADRRLASKKTKRAAECGRTDALADLRKGARTQRDPAVLNAA